jgi:dynein heavy chain 1
MVEAEWGAFRELLNRRMEAISTQIPLLQKKILAEARSIDEKIKQFAEEWATARPISGSLNFTASLDTLKQFETRLLKLREDSQSVQKAKEALDLPAAPDTLLPPVEEELKDLKGVWTELARVWSDVEAIRDTPWPSVVAKKIRTVLEDVLARLKELPNRMRQ